MVIILFIVMYLIWCLSIKYLTSLTDGIYSENTCRVLLGFNKLIFNWLFLFLYSTVVVRFYSQRYQYSNFKYFEIMSNLCKTKLIYTQIIDQKIELKQPRNTLYQKLITIFLSGI